MFWSPEVREKVDRYALKALAERGGGTGEVRRAVRDLRAAADVLERGIEMPLGIHTYQVAIARAAVALNIMSHLWTEQDPAELIPFVVDVIGEETF